MSFFFFFLHSNNQQVPFPSCLFIVVLLWVYWSHQGRQFILSITLAQAQKRPNCLARPSVTAQLACGLWCPFQGIHRPVGRKTRQLLHSKEGCCDPNRCGHSTKLWPHFSAQVPKCLPLSIHPPCFSWAWILFHFFFPSFFPLLLLWPESQGRWSAQADAPHPPSVPSSPKREEQRAGSKVNRICWTATSEGAGEFAEPFWVWLRDLTFCWRGIRQVGSQKARRGKKHLYSRFYHCIISGVWHDRLMCQISVFNKSKSNSSL